MLGSVDGSELIRNLNQGVVCRRIVTIMTFEDRMSLDTATAGTAGIWSAGDFEVAGISPVRPGSPPPSCSHHTRMMIPIQRAERHDAGLTRPRTKGA
jgi:hypothetical protein